ncbi:MAG: hypothetical protein Q7S43_04070 [bacterium]|nr:hypothetical protein [bacterium]
MENTNTQQTNKDILRPIPRPENPAPNEFADENILIPVPDDVIDIIKLSEAPDSIYHYFVASPMFAGFGDLNSQERVYFLQDFSKTSLNLRNYLTSADTVELIFSVGKDSELDDSQISELGILIRELLTGKIFIKDFSIALSSRIGIDDIKAGGIANKIISQSFAPIIEDVKRIQRSKFPEKITQLQKEGRPAGLNQAKPPPLESRGEAPRLPAQLPKPPMMDIRPNPAPTPQPQQRPEFKIPDLAPKIEVKPQSKEGGNQVQKSLEDELEKVANIIDLRNKSEN